MGVPNVGNFGFLKNLNAPEIISKWNRMFGIQEPEKILENTPHMMCNEIAVLGSTVYGQIEIAGIFIKVSSEGKPAKAYLKGSIVGQKVISDQVLKQLQALALERNIPLIEIKDPQYDYGVPDYIKAKVWQFQNSLYRWRSR